MNTKIVIYYPGVCRFQPLNIHNSLQIDDNSLQIEDTIPNIFKKVGKYEYMFIPFSFYLVELLNSLYGIPHRYKPFIFDEKDKEEFNQKLLPSIIVPYQYRKQEIIDDAVRYDSVLPDKINDVYKHWDSDLQKIDQLMGYEIIKLSHRKFLVDGLEEVNRKITPTQAKILLDNWK